MWRAEAVLFAALVLGTGAVRGGEVQKSLGDLEVGAFWIYDDLESGFAESKKAGKPLCIVFR